MKRHIQVRRLGRLVGASDANFHGSSLMASVEGSDRNPAQRLKLRTVKQRTADRLRHTLTRSVSVHGALHVGQSQRVAIGRRCAPLTTGQLSPHVVVAHRTHRSAVSPVFTNTHLRRPHAGAAWPVRRATEPAQRTVRAGIRYGGSGALEGRFQEGKRGASYSLVETTRGYRHGARCVRLGCEEG